MSNFIGTFSCITIYLNTAYVSALKPSRLIASTTPRKTSTRMPCNAGCSNKLKPTGLKGLATANPP